MKKLTKEDFIKKSNLIHKSKYDYSLVDYINERIKVVIICNLHGIFSQNPYMHSHGQGCSKCAIERRIKLQTMTTSAFIKKAKSIHGEKYDYSNVNYIDGRDKVKIICKTHGEFLQKPTTHLNGKGCGSGCPKCLGIISKCEIEFLNYFNIPNTEEHRQICLLRKRVDGLKNNTIYEFLGDYWHGNPVRHNPTEINKRCHKTFGELYENTFNKFKQFKELGYNINYIWETDWKLWKKDKSKPIPIKSF